MGSSLLTATCYLMPWKETEKSGKFWTLMPVSISFPIGTNLFKPSLQKGCLKTNSLNVCFLYFQGFSATVDRLSIISLFCQHKTPPKVVKFYIFGLLCT